MDNLKVKIYWNKNKKMWSIVQKGLVIGYSRCLTLSNVKFIVRQGGRNRCLREKQKNIHAFAEGEIVNCKKRYGNFKQIISYNPYICGHFYDEKKNKIESCGEIYASADGKLYGE